MPPSLLITPSLFSKMKKLITLFGLMLSVALNGSISSIVYAKSYTHLELKQLAVQTARDYNLDTSLICALIRQESRWHSKVTSKVGAIGLMQIMPGTGKSFCGLSQKDLFDPQNNLDCGMRYFRKQLKRFGDEKLALCAYNAGPGRIKNQRCPRFKETIQYVHNILTMRKESDCSDYKPSPSKPSSPPIATSEPSSSPSGCYTIYDQFCKYFPESERCRSGKPCQKKKVDHSEQLYCKYFSGDCRRGKLRGSNMKSMPSLQNEPADDAYEAYCKYFPKDSVCR